LKNLYIRIFKQFIATSNLFNFLKQIGFSETGLMARSYFTGSFL
jgi:hypothetical protein